MGERELIAFRQALVNKANVFAREKLALSEGSQTGERGKAFRKAEALHGKAITDLEALNNSGLLKEE